MTQGVWSLDGCKGGMYGLLAGTGHEGECGWEGARDGGVVETGWMKAGTYGRRGGGAGWWRRAKFTKHTKKPWGRGIMPRV
jgi:hypothetical protein